MSFRLKTVLGIATIELTVMAILIAVNQFALGGSATTQLYQRAEATTRVFANAVADALIATDLATLDATIETAVISEELTYLRIKSPAGITLSEGGAASALAAPFVRDNDFDTARSDHRIDIDLDIAVNGTVYGTIELGISTLAVEKELADALQWNLIVAGIGMSLVAFFGYGLGSILTGQLRWLREGARQISDGKLDHRIHVRGRDELAETATCFNQMAEALDLERTQLKRQRDELLEKKVRVEVIVACMSNISNGLNSASIPDTDRDDEIGAMAQATVVFQNAMNEVQRARKEQQRLISAFNHVAEQVAVFAKTGEVLFMNMAFQEYNASIIDALPNDFTLLDFVNEGLAQNTFPDVSDSALDWIKKKRRIGNGAPFEVLRDGDRVFLTSITFVSNIGWVVSAKDITERRRSENQLVQASKMATLGEMATGVAHELNQPLGVIRMAASNSVKRIQKGACDMDYLSGKFTRIAEQTERASQIINHMRIFGRKAEGIHKPFDLCDAAQEVASLARTQLQTMDIHLAVDLPDNPVIVTGEKVIFEQVLLNLISNARDAIEANATDTKEIRIAVQENDKSAHVVTIQDSGGGIPDQILDRLFEPFFTTKEPGKGTGLGLSISFGTVTAMSGHISAENKDGGACFTVSLPHAA